MHDFIMGGLTVGLAWALYELRWSFKIHYDNPGEFEQIDAQQQRPVHHHRKD